MWETPGRGAGAARIRTSHPWSPQRWRSGRQGPSRHGHLWPLGREGAQMADQALNLWQRLARRIAPVAYAGEARDLNGPGGAISVVDWASMFRPGGQVNYSGQSYQAFQTALASSTNGYSYDTNA